MNHYRKCAIDNGYKLDYNLITMAAAVITMGKEAKEIEMEYYLLLAPLIRGVFQNVSMAEIMTQVENILKRPSMVIDMGFKIIDESPSIDDSYRVYRDNVFLVEKCIDKIRASHIYQTFTNRDFSSALIKCPEHDNFIVASIKINETDVMMLVVFENGIEFTTKDYAVIKRICKVLSVQYQKEGIAYNSHMVFPNHVVFSLLNGEEISRDDFLNRLDGFPWTQYDEHYIMLLDTVKAGIDFRPRHASVLKSLLAFVEENHCLTYKNLIIGFLGRKQFKKIYYESREKFEAFLAANYLICAISQSYTDIMESRRDYLSALLLLCCMRNGLCHRIPTTTTNKPSPRNTSKIERHK